MALLVGIKNGREDELKKLKDFSIKRVEELIQERETLEQQIDKIQKEIDTLAATEHLPVDRLRVTVESLLSSLNILQKSKAEITLQIEKVFSSIISIVRS